MNTAHTAEGVKRGIEGKPKTLEKIKVTNNNDKYSIKVKDSYMSEKMRERGCY